MKAADLFCVAGGEVYFNEFDPFASQWLKNLFSGSVVDSRSIKDVKADDVIRFRRCHFFGGIGGWEHALQLAGWPEDRPVWTGSCPCQPFSSAGKQKGQEDERHLWPEMFRLIRECRPVTVFGEQVSSAIRHGWLDGVFADLEGEGYTCGAAVLGAHSVGSPHIRQRLYWVAHAKTRRRRKESENSRGGSEGDGAERPDERIGSCGSSGRMGESNCDGRSEGFTSATSPRYRDSVIATGSVCGMGDACQSRLEGHRGLTEESVSERRQGENGHGSQSSLWGDFRVVHCTDGKARRTGRRIQPLVNGISREMGRGQPELGMLVKGARNNRVGRLKGYGNAIVPQVAAEFIRALLETEVQKENRHES